MADQTGLMQDASLDAAVAAIMKKLPDEDARVDLNGYEEQTDEREDREDRDAIEREGTGDLEEAEREAKADEADDETQEGDGEAKKAGAEDEIEYIELPASEEGKDGERIPVTEAVEAVQKLRQMDGDIATAVIRAEEDAIQKQDVITQQLSKTFETVAQQAKTALQLMHAYAPQAPDPIMLDRNSGYYDPETYHNAKIHYDAFVAHYHKVQATLEQSEKGSQAVSAQQDTELTRRENDRIARFIPEWKDEKARGALKSEMFAELNKRYGVSQEEFDDITDHKAWRMMHDLYKSAKTQAKAPEIRKAVQEKAPKLKRGNANQSRDPSTGQYANKTRQALRETGSEAAAAAHFIRSGLLDNL